MRYIILVSMYLFLHSINPSMMEQGWVVFVVGVAAFYAILGDLTEGMKGL